MTRIHALDALATLAALKVNYDGFNAARINGPALAAARELLRNLPDGKGYDVFPRRNGGVLIECEVNGCRVSIEVDPAEDVT